MGGRVLLYSEGKLDAAAANLLCMCTTVATPATAEVVATAKTSSHGNCQRQQQQQLVVATAAAIATTVPKNMYAFAPPPSCRPGPPQPLDGTRIHPVRGLLPCHRRIRHGRGEIQGICTVNKHWARHLIERHFRARFTSTTPSQRSGSRGRRSWR